MKTVFDIATPEELLELFGSEESIVFAKEHTNADMQSGYLATIYHWRGDKQKSTACINAIADIEHKLSITLILNEFTQ